VEVRPLWRRELRGLADLVVATGMACVVAAVLALAFAGAAFLWPLGALGRLRGSFRDRQALEQGRHVLIYGKGFPAHDVLRLSPQTVAWLSGVNCPNGGGRA
jgi:hypothetical protein